MAPCVEEVCVYEERLAVGWRALVDQPVSFPFGHGLSYTRFLYTWLATPQRHAASGEVRLGLEPEPLTRTRTRTLTRTRTRTLTLTLTLTIALTLSLTLTRPDPNPA